MRTSFSFFGLVVILKSYEQSYSMLYVTIPLKKYRNIATLTWIVHSIMKTFKMLCCCYINCFKYSSLIRFMIYYILSLHIFRLILCLWIILSFGLSNVKTVICKLLLWQFTRLSKKALLHEIWTLLGWISKKFCLLYINKDKIIQGQHHIRVNVDIYFIFGFLLII